MDFFVFLTNLIIFLRGVGDMAIFLKKLFICVMLMLHTEFQSPTMPVTCQKVCVGAAVRCGGGCNPIFVFSLGQAEQKGLGYQFSDVLWCSQS